MTDLELAVEQFLSSLSDAEWDALVARVRPPKTEPAEANPLVASVS